MNDPSRRLWCVASRDPQAGQAATASPGGASCLARVVFGSVLKIVSQAATARHGEGSKEDRGGRLFVLGVVDECLRQDPTVYGFGS
jgi:hypothetical protein